MTSAPSVTPIDERVLKFLDKATEETGKPPTLTEACAMLGLQPAEMLAALDSGALKGYWHYTPPIPNGYDRVHRHEGAFLPDLMFNFKDNGRYTGRYLCFGQTPVDMLRVVDEQGWSGYVIDPNPPIIATAACALVKSYLGKDPRFTKTLDGWLVRTITVSEVFGHFINTALDIIYIAGTGMDREVWYSDQVQAALPHVYILADDGHNEEVITHAAKRGYRVTLYSDALVMAKPL